MQTAVDLPVAFSVRDENEFYPIQHLLARLHPKLFVSHVATGRHKNGGPTVVWGLVYLNGQPPTGQEAEAALKKAGFEFGAHVLIPAGSVLSSEPQKAMK